MSHAAEAWLSRVQGRPTQTVATTAPNDAFELKLSPEERAWLIAEVPDLKPELGEELGIRRPTDQAGAETTPAAPCQSGR